MAHAAFSEAGVDAPALDRPGTAFRCRGPPTYTLTLLDGRACQLPLEPEGSQEKLRTPVMGSACIDSSQW